MWSWPGLHKPRTTKTLPSRSWRKAADTQDTIPYMEPPYWYYPVRQSLGAALLKTGHPDEAEKEFRAALERERSSAWSLYGLKEAAKAKGDAAAEKQGHGGTCQGLARGSQHADAGAAVRDAAIERIATLRLSERRRFLSLNAPNQSLPITSAMSR